MMNNWLPEIVKRSETGPYIKEADFEMALIQRVRELVKKHGLKFDPQTPIPADDGMADRLWQAGLELFIDIGVYNQSTERRLMFSRGKSRSRSLPLPTGLSWGKVRMRSSCGTAM